MKTTDHIFTSSYRAVAEMAYRLSEVFPLYPITPTSEMSELVEAWSASGKKNVYGQVPSVVQMQSEAGAAGTLHGALLTGSLATTFTASQGLLLMLPNLYKIAGELTPNVLHVATRSVATHALSIFPDHSDIMAVRQCGYAMLGSATPQEAQDFALIAQAATLSSRVPFLHFFDGFRTSHEFNHILPISDEVVRKLIPTGALAEHRSRALDPNRPTLRGSAQGPDIFFQSREAATPYYQAAPGIVREVMNRFGDLTGRSYDLFDYVGHPRAERVIVMMASGCGAAEEAVRHLVTAGERVGLVKVRLYRPFSADFFLSALPVTCRTIGVLDRTLEHGASGDPLYLDIVHALFAAGDRIPNARKAVNGRYGLGGKDLNPGLVIEFLEMLESADHAASVSVGIHRSESNDPCAEVSVTPQFQGKQVKINLGKTPANAKALEAAVKHVAGSPGYFVQRYDTPGYDKAAARLLSDLRLSVAPIVAPYGIDRADLLICDHLAELTARNVYENLAPGGILVLSSEIAEVELGAGPTDTCLRALSARGIRLYRSRLAADDLLHAVATELIQSPDADASGFSVILSRSRECGLTEIQLPVPGTHPELPGKPGSPRSLQMALQARQGNTIAPQLLPPDGSFAVAGTSDMPLGTVGWIPGWDSDACTQCGLCTLACPTGALRARVFAPNALAGAPVEFPTAPLAVEEVQQVDLLRFGILVNPDQCSSCGLCLEACPEDALAERGHQAKDAARIAWAHAAELPELDPADTGTESVARLQFREPLFRYARGEQGCAESQYLKVISQMYGDRLMVANATGSSSIFGGNLPALPWTTDAAGRGPAWANSLFEDNAEFGLGYRMSLDAKARKASALVHALSDRLPVGLCKELLDTKPSSPRELAAYRRSLQELKVLLEGMEDLRADQLGACADDLLDKSVWIVGGDGWACDIGFGGLDHVLASGADVNVLVLDNEIYSNTGGQASKSTPYGAAAGLASTGKLRPKKDLGALAMHYPDVYVASIAIGADPEQTLRVLAEAGAHNGPSLILAYCHSPAHGLDASKAWEHQRLAVATGQWLLYNRPGATDAQPEPALCLESAPPQLPVAEFLNRESRFDFLDEAGLETAQRWVDLRYRRYQQLASLGKAVLLPA